MKRTWNQLITIVYPGYKAPTRPLGVLVNRVEGFGICCHVIRRPSTRSACLRWLYNVIGPLIIQMQVATWIKRLKGLNIDPLRDRGLVSDSMYGLITGVLRKFHPLDIGSNRIYLSFPLLTLRIGIFDIFFRLTPSKYLSLK